MTATNTFVIEELELRDFGVLKFNLIAVQGKILLSLKSEITKFEI